MTGRRFGSLTVVGREPNDTRGNARWRCLCDCGKTTVTTGGKLRCGHTRSCGHLQEQHKREFCKPRPTHGESQTRLHRIWAGMKQRCYDQNTATYRNYGMRGITVCDEWLNSYEAFRDWANANGYRDDLSIDRIDVNGNYEPSNCRWVTMRVQGNNCKAIFRRKSGADNVERRCPVCGKPFVVNKYSRVKTCSGECGVKLRWGK